jgi:hypothetical protein
MNKRQILLAAGLSTVFTLTIIAAAMLVSTQVIAAPSLQGTATPTPTPTESPQTYLSVSAMAFMPIDPATRYQKDVLRQLLTLDNSSTSANNIFVAPLALADKRVLTGMTVFGEDFDNQGAVQMRLKRCDHSQARCATLAQMTSSTTYASGQFETPKAVIANEVVNNYFYSYFLELTLSEQSKGGLRSVRLEMTGGESLPPVGEAKEWTLTGNVTNFLIPTQGITQVRVCTDDLSHLPNATHYPNLVVDNNSYPLSSNDCRTVWGSSMRITRDLNTGPSTGTYQILR